jgi:hypothetical protein
MYYLQRHNIHWHNLLNHTYILRYSIVILLYVDTVVREYRKCLYKIIQCVWYNRSTHICIFVNLQCLSYNPVDVNMLNPNKLIHCHLYIFHLHKYNLFRLYLVNIWVPRIYKCIDRFRNIDLCFESQICIIRYLCICSRLERQRTLRWYLRLYHPFPIVVLVFDKLLCL